MFARILSHFIVVLVIFMRPTPVGHSGDAGLTPSGARLTPAAMKVMNYYPAERGWDQMWTHYDHATTDHDFGQIASLNANTVRIIVQANTVGYPTVGSSYAATLKDMIATAAAHDLHVQLTLFDWWSDYADIAGSERWASNLLAPYRNDHRISLVELQNEIDPTNATAMTWARAMLPYLAQLLPGVPRTLDVRGGTADSTLLRQLLAAVPASMLDVIDLHLYGGWGGIVDNVDAAKQLSGGRPVIIGEAGLPTDTESVGTDQQQAQFYAKLASLAASRQLPPPAPWTFTDFTSGAISVPMSSSEYTYGLRRTNGTWKPAADVVRSMFQPQATGLALDGTFAHENTSDGPGTQLGSWQAYAPSMAAQIGTSCASGTTCAGFIRGAGGNDSAWPSLMQELLIITRAPMTLSATVALTGATGATQIALAWFANTTYLGSSQSVSADNAHAGAQTLKVTATPPANATVVQIHLKSGSNAGTATFSGVNLTP